MGNATKNAAVLQHAVPDLDAGTLTLDLPYTHIVYQKPLLSLEGERCALSVALVFHQRLSEIDDDQADFGLRKGYKLSVQKKIVDRTATHAKMIDERGKIVEFNGAANVLIASDGSGRIMRSGSTDTIVEDIDGNREFYTPDGRITAVRSLYDGADDGLIFTYQSIGGKLRLSGIRDAAGREISLTYADGNVVSILAGSLQTAITYTENGMALTDRTGATTQISLHTALHSVRTMIAGTETEGQPQTLCYEKTGSAIRVLRQIGGKETENTLYTFLSFDEWERGALIEVCNRDGVKQRLQYQNEELLYTYEADYTDNTDQMFLERGSDYAFKADVRLTSETQALGELQQTSVLPMTKLTTGAWFCVVPPMPETHNYLVLSGWIKLNANVAGPTIRIGSTPGVPLPLHTFSAPAVCVNDWFFVSDVFAYSETSSAELYIVPDIVSAYSYRDLRLTPVSMRLDSKTEFFVTKSEDPTDASIQKRLDRIENVLYTANGTTHTQNLIIRYSDLDCMLKQLGRGGTTLDLVSNNLRNIVPNCSDVRLKIGTSEYSITNILACSQIYNGIYGVITETGYNTAGAHARTRKIRFNDSQTYESKVIYDDKYAPVQALEGDRTLQLSRGAYGGVTQSTFAASGLNPIVEKAEYSHDGNLLTKSIDENDNVTSYDYDSYSGLATKCTPPVSAPETYNFDAGKSVVTSIETSDGTTALETDFVYRTGDLAGLQQNGLSYSLTHTGGELASVSVGGTEIYSRTTSADNRTVEESRNGHTRKTQTDKYGRVTQISTLSYGSYQPELSVVYDTAFYENMPLTGVSNQSAKPVRLTDEAAGETYAYSYDETNGLLKKTAVTKNGATVRTTVRETDKLGRTIKTETTHSDGEKAALYIDYVYGDGDVRADERIGTVKSATGNRGTVHLRTDYLYDSLKRPVRVGHTIGGKQYRTEYGYVRPGMTNGQSTVQSVRYYTPTSTLPYRQEDLTFDAENRITRISDARNADNDVRYHYDSFGRLTREDNKARNETRVYVYDERGNRTEDRMYAYTTGTLPSNFSVTTYEYASSTRPDRLTKKGTESLSYNSAGEPTAWNGKSASFDRNGRFSKWSYMDRISGNWSYQYTYDAFGRRTCKHYSFWGGQQSLLDREIDRKTYYTYEDDRLIKQKTEIQMKKGGYYEEQMIFLYDAQGVRGCRYTDRNGVTKEYFYLRNLAGDILEIYENGTCICEYIYDAWGGFYLRNKVSNSFSAVNPFRYRGYYYDAETQLYYLNSRYYDPSAARFISPDIPDYLDPASVNGLNLYAYCANDPISYCDPAGCFPILIALILGAGALIGGAIGGKVAYDKAKNTDKSGAALFWSTVGGVAIGGLFGFAGGGLIIGTAGIGTALIGSAGLATQTILGVTAMQAFGLGFAAFNIAGGILLAFGIEMQGIDYETPSPPNIPKPQPTPKHPGARLLLCLGPLLKRNLQV